MAKFHGQNNESSDIMIAAACRIQAWLGVRTASLIAGLADSCTGLKEGGKIE